MNFKFRESLNGCKDIGLAVNTGETKYMEIGHHRDMMVNEHIRICSKSYEKVKTFQFLGYLLTNQNSIQEDIKCRLKTGDSCYYSVQTFLSCRIFSKNLKIKIHETIILPVVLYGCEARSLKLREERRPRAFENRILRRMFGPKRDANGEWRRLYNEELNSL